jgi:C1A family cysteine protease
VRGYDFLDYKFNLIKSPEDPRDFVYSWLVKSQVLPSKLSRDNECSPIRDQGKFGVCYSFAGEGMKEWQEWKEHPKEKPILSPLFLAQECKKIDGSPNTEGSTIKAVVDVLHKVGICYESTYPFENYKEALKFPTVPSRAYGEALNFKIKNYAKCYTLEDIKLAIVNSGLILAGVMVTDSFLTPENGFINMPLGRILGGHAICCVGFDDNLIYTYKNGVTKKGFLRIRNSWNTSWGDKGYAWLPYDFYYGKIVDLGSPYFFEAWSTVDLTEVLPDEQVNSSEKEEIILWIGKNEALLDGVKTTLLQSPILLKGSTLLPIRFVAENMGYSVEWVGSEKKVILRKK